MPSENATPALKVIDQWLRYQQAQGDTPGFQVSIRRNGKLIFNSAYGHTDLKRKTKLRTSHVGIIASQSKTIIATIALHLHSKKQFDIYKPLVQYLPELKKHTDERFKQIRVIDLLTNRSGIFRDSYEYDYWGKKVRFPTAEKLIEEVLNNKLVYSPNTITKYSNVGFALLGITLERVTEKSLEQLAKLLNIPATTKHTSRCAQGHLRKQLHGQRFEKAKRPATNALTAAAGFYSNPEKMSEFFHKLYLTDSVLPKRERTLLLNKKWTVANSALESYGIGTIFNSSGKNVLIGHSGGFPGFSSQTWVDPKSKIACSFMANVSMLKSFQVIQSITEILRIIETNFKKSEMKSLIVSKPFADNFCSTIYVLGKSKAIAFALTGWRPTEDVMIFNRRGEYYYSDKISGFKNIGEPIKFEFKAKRKS